MWDGDARVAMSLQGVRVARNVGVLSSEAAGTGLNWAWEEVVCNAGGQDHGTRVVQD